MRRAAGFAILAVFYAFYIGKMLLQRQRGIKTDQIAKGRRNRIFYVELVLKLATYSAVAAEIASIVLGNPNIPIWVFVSGCVLGLAGDVVFALAIITMKDSWRAGLAEADETEMITGGIYRFSRNPAFLGFDFVYTGILLMFFNWVLLVFSLSAMIMLHIQILQEESYLERVFGEAYVTYKNSVRRYFGRVGK